MMTYAPINITYNPSRVFVNVKGAGAVLKNRIKPKVSSSAGITNGTTVKNSMIGRQRGIRNCTQYEVGTTNNALMAMVMRAERNENKNVCANSGALNTL